MIELNKKINAFILYQAALKKRGKNTSPSDLSGSYNNIGLVYRQMGDSKKAVEYYMKSLQICVQNNIRIGMGNAYNNIGALYQMQKDYWTG